MFQSTRPMRGATTCSHYRLLFQHSFNPRAPCGARPKLPTHVAVELRVSIHAPHAGRDPTEGVLPDIYSVFQSTRPMRGATLAVRAPHHRKEFQSTRPMRGATLGVMSKYSPPVMFQSTRPMRGATPGACKCAVRTQWFQSTRPMRGATQAAGS